MHQNGLGYSLEEKPQCPQFCMLSRPMQPPRWGLRDKPLISSVGSPKGSGEG